jgi:hypothetical protein
MAQQSLYKLYLQNHTGIENKVERESSYHLNNATENGTEKVIVTQQMKKLPTICKTRRLMPTRYPEPDESSRHIYTKLLAG